MWLSLVERYVRDVEVAGSNPVTPTAVKEEEFRRGSGALFLFMEMECSRRDCFIVHEDHAPA